MWLVRFKIREAPALGPGPYPFHGRTLVHHDRRDFQLVDIRTLIVFRIGNGGIQHLLDEFGTLFLAETEDIQGLLHGQPPNLIRDQAPFLGCEVRVT